MERRLVVIAFAGLVAGCFDAGEVQSTDASPSDLGVGADGEAPDGAMSGPCGGCSGETPVCLAETETCVECLEDGDCDGELPVCDATANVCVACLPEEESEWFPDGDGDGFGNGSVAPTVACEAPEGMVDNAEDCDDTAESVHSEADEVCNDRDDDCDEEADEAVVPGECGKQEGVCAGATIATCSDEKPGYAACGAGNYGGKYVASDHEEWHCDGADNDCDGEVDDVCCPEGETPETIGAGEIDTHDVNAAVAPAVSGADAEHRFALAWSVGDTVKLRYPDADGAKSQDLWGDEVIDVEIVPGGSGYLVAVILEKPDNGGPISRVELHRFNSSLVHEGKVTTVESLDGGELSGLSMAVDGQTTWLTYSRETPLDEYDIIVGSFDNGSDEIARSPGPVTDHRLWEPGRPEIAVVGGRATVAWWNAHRAQVRGVFFSGKAISERFHWPAGQTDREANEPIAVVAAGGQARVVFPYYVGADTTELTYLSVEPNQAGAVGSGTALTGAMARHRDPAAVPVDRSGDGESDHLVGVWEAGADGLQVGRIALDTPESMTPQTVYGGGAESLPDMAVDERRVLAVWNDLFIRNGENQMVYGAPASVDGVPVCRGAEEGS